MNNQLKENQKYVAETEYNLYYLLDANNDEYGMIRLSDGFDFGVCEMNSDFLVTDVLEGALINMSTDFMKQNNELIKIYN